MAHRVDRDLTRITAGEWLFIERTRRGETQEAAAARLEVGQRSYGTAELASLCVPIPPGFAPTQAEQCRLARRRYGRDLRSTAAALRCSHVTLLAGEAAGADWLVARWRRRGFIFKVN